MNDVRPDRTRPLVVALVNNASERARLRVERQFASVVRAAAGGRCVRLRLFACPQTAPVSHAPCSGTARTRALEALFRFRPDAVIVTGKEPQTARLQDEPVWGSLVRIADWAQRYDVPVLWSCLAAHAAVLHLAGVLRTALPAKLSGVFDCDLAAPEHPLAAGLPPAWAGPHSRSYDVAEAALRARGYRILSRSAEAGVDLFAGPANSRFVFCQGHLEYEAGTLLAEYRRDLRRAMTGQRRDIPAAPANLDPCGEAAFSSPWRSQAIRFYANWLDSIAARPVRGMGDRDPVLEGA